MTFPGQARRYRAGAVRVGAAWRSAGVGRVDGMSELLLAYSWWSFLTLPTTPEGWTWLCVGFCGNACFFTRFLIQWIHSERAGESRFPVIFWWQSMVGTILLLAYFIHKGDPVGILGYVLNVIPYSRNLVLVYRKRRLAAPACDASE